MTPVGYPLPYTPPMPSAYTYSVPYPSTEEPNG